MDKLSLLFSQRKTTGYQNYINLTILKKDDGSIVPPGAFIPAAERYDLMPQIDRWVLYEAFSCIQPGEAYSINLSGQTVSDESLASYIEALQAKYSIDAKQITFEITETAAIQKLDKTIAFINRLKQNGFHFSLDDFGTGLSSFSYLKNLAVDYLKIDGSFVKDIAIDSISYAMVKSVNDVGHSMGLKTIAEYVENVEILDKLNEIGVDFAQGYYLHKPQALEEITNMANVIPLKVVK